MAKSKNGSSSTSLILLSVAAFCLATWWLFSLVNGLVSTLLDHVFPEYESSHQFAWPNLIGGIYASNVTLYNGGDTVLRASRFDLNLTPTDWLQILATKNKNKQADRIDSYRLKLGGLEIEDWAGVFDNSGWIGESSASPFEAEGCEQDGLWTRGEVEQMMSDAGRTDFYSSWEVVGDLGVSESRLVTKGVSDIIVRREDRITETDLLGSVEEMQLSSLEINVIDEGFVKARNTHCANKDDVSEALFIERHLAAVDRNFQVEGWAVTDSMKQSYRRFVESGDEMVVSLRFSGEMANAQVITNQVLAKNTSGTISVGGRQALVRVISTGEKPWPENENLVSTFDAMRYEGSLPPELLTGSIVNPLPLRASAQSTADKSEQQFDDKSVETTLDKDPATATPLEITKIGDLKAHIGRIVWLYRSGREPEVVRVLKVNNEDFRVERKYGSGSIDFTVANSDFIKVTFKR